MDGQPMTSVERVNTDYLETFMAVQVSLMKALTQFSENPSPKKQDIMPYIQKLLEFQRKITRISEQLYLIYEADQRNLLNVLGKYGGTPDAFGFMNSPTDKVSLEQARWATSSSARVKNED